MRIGNFIRDVLPERINRDAQARGLESWAEKVQGGAKYAATGVLLPNLLRRVQQHHPSYQRCHVAIGARLLGNEDFELGDECQRPAYIGIRTQNGSQTLSVPEHAEIFEETFKSLRVALDDQVTLQPRDQFWSIWGYLPTTDSGGHLRSAEEYEEFVVDELLKAWLAIKDLWDEDGGVRKDSVTIEPSGNGLTRASSARPSAKTNAPKRWAYRIGKDLSEDELEALGDEGWEAYAVTLQDGRTLVHMKRPK